MKSRVYGYVRVSTVKQKIERQIENIKNKYPEAVIIAESYTGTKMDRPAWNKLYKKDLFRDLRYPKGRIFEDEFTTYKALYKCSKICFVDLPLYYYLQRSDSIIGVMNGHRDSKVVEAYLQRIDFYRDNNEDALWRKGIMHCLHMMCYFNLNCANADSADGGINKCYRKEFLSAVNCYSQAYKSFGTREKFEIVLYKLNAGLYYRIWRMTKRN